MNRRPHPISVLALVLAAAALLVQLAGPVTAQSIPTYLTHTNLADITVSSVSVVVVPAGSTVQEFTIWVPPSADTGVRFAIGEAATGTSKLISPGQSYRTVINRNIAVQAIRAGSADVSLSRDVAR